MVYVVISGQWEDFDVLGVYKNESDAEIVRLRQVAINKSIPGWWCQVQEVKYFDSAG